MGLPVALSYVNLVIFRLPAEESTCAAAAAGLVVATAPTRDHRRVVGAEGTALTEDVAVAVVAGVGAGVVDVCRRDEWFSDFSRVFVAP